MNRGRHLKRHQHRPALEGLARFSPRQAARVRELVRADLLPEERALADATVLTAWLSPAQRARYAPSLRAVDDPDEFVERLADERRVVLEEGADPVPGEVEEAAAAERAARQTPLRVLEAVLLAGALACFVAIVLLLEASDLRNLDATPAWVPELAVGLVCCLVGAAVIGAVATRRRDSAMLSWAVSRPGQLGRGIPLRRSLQAQSVGPAVLGSLGPAALIGVGVLTMVAGAALALISLMLRTDQDLTVPGIIAFVAGVIAFGVGVLLFYRRSRQLETIIRRTQSLQWFGPLLEDGFTEDEPTDPVDDPGSPPRAG